VFRHCKNQVPMYMVHRPNKLLSSREAASTHRAECQLVLDTRGHQNLLLKTSAPEKSSSALKVSIFIGVHSTRGRSYSTSLSLSPAGATIGYMGQGYLHRPYIRLRLLIGLETMTVEAHGGQVNPLAWRTRRSKEYLEINSI